MRNLILIAFLLSTTISFSQSAKRVSYISCDKDTLLLPNSELGHRILSAWANVEESQRPVMLLVPESLIERMNRMKYSGRKEDAAAAAEPHEFPAE